MSEIVGFYSGPSLGLSKPPASLFVLSGEEHTLPSAEIRALVKTYSRVSECSQQGKRIILSTLSDPTIIETITKRAAYCRFGGVLVSFSGGLNSLAVSLNLDLS